MIRNYFLVAFRNLTRNKFFSAINIFGLSVAMSICLGIIMLVADQLTYDRYNTRRERIYRINTQTVNPDGSVSGNDYATSPLMLGEEMKTGYAGIEETVRLRRGFGNGWIEFEQNVNIPLGGFFADANALDFFQYELEHGDKRTALKEPYSVVLTKKAARKLFTQDNPVGEIIKVGELGEYKVTGVIKETDHKSHIVFEALASYSTVESLEANEKLGKDGNWDNYTAGWVYLLLKEGYDAPQIEREFAKLTKLHKPAPWSANDNRSYKFYLQNISEITPGAFINNSIGPFMPRIFVYFFGGLALIVMLTSCFNYTNLSIARSLTRAREIGVRKVNGAHRHQIFFQFIAESVLLAFFALAVSVGLLLIVKPFLLNLNFARVLKWDLEGNLFVYSAFAVFSLVVGIMAGFFPAVVLSKFQPVKVLKNAGGGLKLFSRVGLRKSLLVIQFSLSLVFIISVILLYNQLALFTEADHGFDMKSKIAVKLNSTAYDVLQNELKKQSNVVNVAPVSHLPATGMNYGDGYKHHLSDESGVVLSHYYVDHNYIDNMKLNLIAGRNFREEDGASNSNFMIINERAVKALHFDSNTDALGQVLFMEADSSKVEIIGVLKDYNHSVMMEQIQPLGLKYNPKNYSLLQVQYAGTYDNAAKTVEAAWAKVNPSLKLDYTSFEEEIGKFYETVFSDFVSIVGVLAFMAIFIACLGLLGMATYTIETRMKEISIRKVLGSSDHALVLLLSKSFAVLLVIAIFFALPLSWFINNLWLEMIAYRTSFSVSVVATGVLTLLVLGLLTVGSQTLRAAFANPADNLKNE